MFDSISDYRRSVLTPLAISANADNQIGQLKCIGIYQHAINFITPKNSLLTLQRFGKGLTPSGWLLKKQDFDRFAYLTQLGFPIHQTNIGIYCQDITIQSHHVRQLQLTVPMFYCNSPSNLQTILKTCEHPTGLYGKLSTVNCSISNHKLEKYVNFLEALKSQHPLNYTALLGEGPGLTPSSDDILIGILAYAYTQPGLNNHLKNILSPLQQLTNLTPFTTLISCYFIQQASYALFSSNIIGILNNLKNSVILHRKVLKLLNYGHTSGADTLIGICLAESFFTKK